MDIKRQNAPEGGANRLVAEREPDGASSRLSPAIANRLSFDFYAREARPAGMRHARILGYGRDDAEDLVQEGLLRCFLAREDYDPSRASFGVYFRRVLTNLHIDRMRRKHGQTFSLDAELVNEEGARLQHTLTDTRSNPLDRVVAQQLDEPFHSAVLSLADHYRTPLLLDIVWECDYQTIAAILSVPVGTVRSRLYRARALLRSELSKMGALHG
jgi:RNA polymerase sigma-70 factor (ECF subfamily)